MFTQTERLQLALMCFEGTKGDLVLSGRSPAGIGQTGLVLHPCFHSVPMPLLAALLDGYSFRLSAITRKGGTAPCDLPVVCALWRPTTAFHATAQDRAAAGEADAPLRRHFVPEAAAERVRAAIATMPAPSLVIHAGGEIWAGWRLARPLPAGEAGPILARLATRLGAERPPADLATFDLPFAGAIRNWNQNELEYISVAQVNPQGTYELKDLDTMPATPLAIGTPPTDQGKEIPRERDRNSATGNRRRARAGRA